MSEAITVSMGTEVQESASDVELAGYILQKFQHPDVRVTRGKGGEVVTETLDLPTLEGICFELGITGSEFEARCEVSPVLRRVVELGHQREYDMVVRGGLGGGMNGSFAGLLMKNRHKWMDKAESKVSGELVINIMKEGAGL